MFEGLKKAKEEKKKILDKIDKKIEKVTDSDSKESAQDLVSLVETRRTRTIMGVDANEVFKGAMNVAIVAVIIAFEMSHIMNAKASRFIKTL
jgi:hypothetical protein